MKIRSERKIPQANKIFTDREEPRQTFWRHYEMMKSQLAEIADVRVITYYGIGGVGKSTLLKKLMEEVREKITKPGLLYFDLGIVNESRNVLENMRNKLSEEYRFSFPLFDLSVYTYAKKLGENMEAPEIKTFAGKSPVLSAVLEFGQMLPGVGTLAQIVSTADKGITFVRNLLTKYRKEIAEFDMLSQEDLLAKIPYFFALDMAENLQNFKEPFVFFLDTYEKMVNEMSSIGEPLNNDLWLRGEEGLIQNIPNVLWVIAGREKLKWTRFDPEWNDALDQHILGSLSYADTAGYLHAAGIQDETLVQELYDLTHGTPVYLDLCVDRFLSVSETKTPTIEDFGSDTYSLIERFARYLDDAKKDIVYLFSCLGTWEEELIQEIAGKVIPNFSITSYEKVKDFSFLSETSPGIYTMHQTVAETLFESCPPLIREKSVAEALDYSLKKIRSSSWFSDSLPRHLRTAVRLSLLQYEDDEEYVEFYNRELNDVFIDLMKAARFQSVNDAFDPIYQRGTESGTTVLTALVLRVKARILLLEGKYEESLSPAEKSVELFTQILGSENEQTLESQFRWGWCLTQEGKYQEARDLSESALSCAVKLLGENHLLTVKLKSLFANALYSLGLYQRSYPIFKEVLENRKKILGETHPDTISAMGNVASVLSELGRYEEALEIKKEVFEKRKEILEEKHPDTVRALNGLAWTYYLMGNEKEGVLYAEKLFNDIHKSELSLKSKISYLDTVALVFAEVGKVEEAKIISLEILSEAEEKYRDNDDFMGRRYQTMGVIYDKSKEQEKAFDFFQKAVEKYQKTSTREELAECLEWIQKYEDK